MIERIITWASKTSFHAHCSLCVLLVAVFWGHPHLFFGSRSLTANKTFSIKLTECFDDPHCWAMLQCFVNNNFSHSVTLQPQTSMYFNEVLYSRPPRSSTYLWTGRILKNISQIEIWNVWHFYHWYLPTFFFLSDNSKYILCYLLLFKIIHFSD